MAEPTIQVFPDLASVAAAAAELIVGFADEAITERGVFSIALSGGNTPKTLFELMASGPYAGRIDWAKCEIYFGDERCVPPTDKASNYKMAAEALLSRVPIKAENVFRMKGEIEPEKAASEYDQLLKAKFGDGGMDLILLGMGDNGHTASLFPYTKALEEREHRCVAIYVEEVKMWRITMSAPFINKAAQIMILVSGEGKAKMLSEVMEGPRDPNRLPIQMIEPVSGRLMWLLDAPAAGMHEE